MATRLWRYAITVFTRVDLLMLISQLIFNLSVNDRPHLTDSAINRGRCINGGRYEI